MNKLFRPLIPISIASAIFSANVLADGGWRHEHWGHRHHYPKHRLLVQQIYQAPPQVVTYGVLPQVAYQAPPVVVYQAPPTIYRERVVYHDRPVYYEVAPASYSNAYPGYNANRAMGQAVGAVAGGILGNQIGRGDGRIAATVMGAVIGSAIGGSVTRIDY